MNKFSLLEKYGQINDKNSNYLDSVAVEFKEKIVEHIKVNLMQNTAISFSVCIEDKYNNFEELRKILAKKFKVSYNENVSLYTIRHFDENAAQVVETNKIILLRQISRETMQVITKE